LLYVIIII